MLKMLKVMLQLLLYTVLLAVLHLAHDLQLHHNTS